ncbi:acetolactate synthase 3 large subunit, partial [Streptococcus danieliae]|nr:acetolactate synthase 3 large subunit [Streptococcus danieliae]
LDALCDSIPLICISGQVATTSIGTNAFQECDALGISRPVTKWNRQIRTADETATVVQEAYAQATQGRPGPVLIDFPKDLQLAAVADSTPPQHAATAAAPLPDSTDLERAASLIANARQPVFYGGGGLINSGLDA